METVHIVMASYNGERYLGEQMDSLLSQSYPGITVEVCDDGSTDGTCDIVKRYAARDGRVSLHRNAANQGYVKNFLEGMRRSTADYIMLCDQDDVWDRDKVEVTLRAMKQEEERCGETPTLIFTDAMNYDSDSGTELGRFHKNSHLNTKKVDTAHLFMENKIIGCTVMVNRAVIPYLSEIPDGIRVHDWWLALICSHFGQIAYVDRPTLKYRQHGDNMIGGDTFGGYVGSRLSGIARQRAVLESSYRQGAAFLAMFGDRMTAGQQEIAGKFSDMAGYGWCMRRWNMMKYGFVKSGIVRNIGLFLVI